VSLIRRLDRRSRSDDGRDEPRGRADDQHREIRNHGRGGKGRELLQRGQFTKVIWPIRRHRNRCRMRG
jgi:hypothetical protein